MEHWLLASSLLAATALAAEYSVVQPGAPDTVAPKTATPPSNLYEVPSSLNREQTLQYRLEVLKAARNSLLLRYTEAHPEVRSIDRQIKLLEGQIQAAALPQS